MIFEIKHRTTGSVLFSLECTSLKLCVEAAVSSKANLSSANLRSADLRSANLSSANLRSADLSSADLSSADLRWADLRWANLSSANLRSADLSSADLRWADLRSARGDFATPEESDAMLAKIAELVLAKPERLDMGAWHGEAWDATHTPEEEHSCKTTHCMAGWAQALCPVPFIRRMDAQHAGLLLIPTAVHMFHATNEEALEFLKSKLTDAKAGAS
jgi:hypothetical protein